MEDFAYARAREIAEATAALASRDTALLAGGTELLNWLRLGIAAPTRLVDIEPLGLDRISASSGPRGTVLTIGARATLAAIGEHPLVRAHGAVLADACLAAASAQIRNRATLGGNVLQKTRCPYFRAESPLPWGCNKRQRGSGCAALRGVNERMAILGWTEDCMATQPSDPVVALACLDATVTVTGPDGERSLPIRTFHRTQQEAVAEGLDAATAETRLRPGEIIVSFALTARADEQSAYVKVRERASYEYALVSAAASVRIEDGRIAAARIALGSVAQRPWRLDAAEAALVGQRLDGAAIRPLVAGALADARTLSQNEYKLLMAINAATRALLMAGGAR
jgi:xanthine dehydrogenase YagS FAD-binding subunit